MSSIKTSRSTHQFLEECLQIKPLPARTSPLDPGYAPATLESHLEQSGQFMEILKLSMACWQIADEAATRKKIAAAHAHNVKVGVGGGPFEIAKTFGKMSEYLDLCSDLTIDRIEAGEGFTDNKLSATDIINECNKRNLEVQFELGEKHKGTFDKNTVEILIKQGLEWLDAGAKQLVIEARESGEDIGLFDFQGNLNVAGAESFVNAFGIDNVCFEAPNKSSQFKLLNHFGADIHISNVRLEELLRIEIYRRGLHSDAFCQPRLKPSNPR
ncbi:MAG: phosphosulfolactate synthase [Pseudomonadota bacterium]